MSKTTIGMMFVLNTVLAILIAYDGWKHHNVLDIIISYANAIAAGIFAYRGILGIYTRKHGKAPWM